jgi:hypothetical protein
MEITSYGNVQDRETRAPHKKREEEATNAAIVGNVWRTIC